MIEDIETYWHEVNDALHENLLSKVDSDEVEDNDDYFNEDDCVYIMMRIDMDGRRAFPNAAKERIKSYFDFLKKRGIVHKYDVDLLDFTINANIHLWIDKSYLDVQLFNEVLFCIIAIMKEYFTFGLSVEKFIDDDTFVKKLYIDNTNSKEAILIINTNEYKNMFPNISETEYLSSIVKASAKYGLTRCIDREYDIYHLYIVREYDGEYIVYYDEANVRRLIIRKNGEIIYEFQVKSLIIADKFDLFHNGLLAVFSFQKNVYYLMNRDGKFVNKSFKDIVGFTANGVIVRLFEDDSVGLVDGKGNLIADNNYKIISQYSNGFAVVEYEDGGYNYIDATGTELFDEKKFGCENFDDDGYGIILDNKGIGVCNNKGNILFQSEKFKGISRVGSGLWVVSDKNHSDVDCNNLVNTKGKYLSKYWFYVYNNSFHNGMMRICNSKLGYTFIDMKGDVLCKKADGTPDWFTDCGSFDEGGNAIVLRNNKMNFIDKSGNLISRKWFDKRVGIDLSVSQFSEDFAIVRDKKNALVTKYNFIDRTGRILSKIWFDEVESNFKNGYAVVKIDGYLGIIDKYGVMVHSDYSKYSKIDVFIDGIARVQRYEGDWNCIRTDGTLVLKEWYGTIIRFDNISVFEVSKINENGKKEYSFCNANGKFIFGKRWFVSGTFSINTYVDSIILCDNKDTPQWNMITSKGKLLFYGEWSGIKIVPVEIGDSFVYRIDNVFYVDGTGNLLSFV